jgi:asparagine synthase (glutamine-hydrolysing)
MNFLTDSYPSTHQTLYSDVFRLLPGHFAEFSNGVYQEHRYWYPPATEEQYSSYVEVLHRFDVLFAQSVARRLSTTQSAVIQLSGGLDSSAIFRAALDWVSERENERIPDLTLFSAAYPGLPCDEREYFSETAKLGPFKHHIWKPGKQCWIDTSGLPPHEPPMIWRADLHYGMNQIMATMGAKLAVMGVGGDELVFEKDTELDLFRSQSWFNTKKWSTLRKLGLRRAVMCSLRCVAPSLADGLVDAYRRTLSQPVEIPDWMQETLRASSGSRVSQRTTESFAFHSFAQQATWGRITNPRLLSNLECNQQIAENHGYACAFPFLDKKLVEFFLRLPSEYRARDRLPKQIIRDVFAHRLPKTVVERTAGSDYTPLYPWQIRRNRKNIKHFLRQRHWNCEPYIARRRFISLAERHLQSASIPIDVASFLRRVIDLEYLLVQLCKESDVYHVRT